MNGHPLNAGNGKVSKRFEKGQRKRENGKHIFSPNFWIVDWGGQILCCFCYFYMFVHKGDDL